MRARGDRGTRRMEPNVWPLFRFAVMHRPAAQAPRSPHADPSSAPVPPVKDGFLFHPPTQSVREPDIIMLQRLKHLIVILLLAGFASQPALAEGLNQDDMAFAFGDSAVNSDWGEMAFLSDREMDETEGEWVPLAIFAARVGYSAWKGYRAYKQTRTIYRGYKAVRSGYRYAKPSRWKYRPLKHRGHSVKIKSHRGRDEFRAEIHPVKIRDHRKTRKLPHFHARPGIGRHRPWERRG